MPDYVAVLGGDPLPNSRAAYWAAGIRALIAARSSSATRSYLDV